MARSATRQSAKDARLARLTAGLRPVFLYIFGLSGIINILALTGAFYMMQIYDRALMSASIPTLALISALALGLYMFQGGLDVIRSQILHRVGARFDARIAPDIHRMSIDMPRYGFSVAEAMERGRTVDTLRNFFGGQALVSLFDLPWMPIFLAFVFALHPYLGALAIGGAVVLTLMTVLTELMTRKANSQVSRAAVQRSAVAEANARNADVIKAMGFSSQALAQFQKANDEHLTLQSGSSDVTRTVAALSKVLRMMLQSAVLGLGAYLTIMGEMTAGAIIAASVASARALAPIDSTIANWKNLIAARNAMATIRQTMAALPEQARPLQLPDPARAFSAEGITVVAPGSGRVLLSDVTIQLEAGQALGLIGPSGGGKSSLMRAMAGVWPVLRGHVRLDGADLVQWGDDKIACSFGYLPQDYTLFDTTIARNISRLADPDSEKVIAAARAAGVHEMILAMPDGYETELGANVTSLSGGQRQRIALARALYGDPFVVLLDEPNSNLDAEGERAVSHAIQSVRDRGGIVIVVAHRPSALEHVDLVGVVQHGALSSFGPKSEIMRVKPATIPTAMPLRETGAATRAASVPQDTGT
jgi:ATP-binding cassette subfamily C protein